jgi:CHAD domain-containing protein
VHEARREIKRLRALLRLAPASATALARRTREVTGDVRQRLGESRDAAVMADTLASLEGDGEVLGRIGKVLARHRQSREARRAGRCSASEREALQNLSMAWSAWEPAGTLADLRKSAVRTYRKARKRASRLEDETAASVHALRKAAVDLQHQLDFLLDGNGGMRKRRKRIGRLRDKLGACHDLDHLWDFVRERADVPAGDLEALEAAMAGPRKRLLRQSAKLAEKLFRPKARRFGKRLRGKIGAPPAR